MQPGQGRAYPLALWAPTENSETLRRHLPVASRPHVPFPPLRKAPTTSLPSLGLCEDTTTGQTGLHSEKGDLGWTKGHAGPSLPTSHGGGHGPAVSAPSLISSSTPGRLPLPGSHGFTTYRWHPPHRSFFFFFRSNDF